MTFKIQKPSSNTIGAWKKEEDNLILTYVYQKLKANEKIMWKNLTEDLPSRSGKSCRERWHNHLDPNIKRADYSHEEQWVAFILKENM